MIRKIEKKDNKILASIIRNVFEEFDAPKTGTVYSDKETDHLFELFQKEQSVLWIIEIDGIVKGCCGIYPSEGLPNRCVELVKFYFSPEIRGKGYGIQLLELCISSAQDLGYKNMYIESMPHFSTAVRLYEKFGFTQLHRSLGDSAHTSCDIWMLKEL